MAELRVKGTGTLKLFESDNTSSVTIASPASLGADRTITLPDADVTLSSGTMATTNGITESDFWRITTTYNDQEDDGFVFTANWERVDTDSFSKIGTGMSESSGIFTFPSTGIYLVEARFVIYDDRSHAVIYGDLEITTDDGSYGDAARANTNLYAPSTSYNYYSSCVCSHQFDVTDVATHKVRLAGSCTGNELSDSLNWQGATAYTSTSIRFTRLGDT